MQVISFGSLKGGTGKTSIAILLIRYLAKCGYRILAVDLDINNALSFVLTPENIDEVDVTGSRHIAAALQSQNFFSAAIPSNVENVDLIRSSLYLVDLRTIATNRLKTLLKQADQNKYDYVILDTAPTYDNLTLMAYEASDLIITPVLLSQFDYNTGNFLAGKLESETNVYDRWQLLYNGYNTAYDQCRTSKQADYRVLFESTFTNIMSSRLPWTALIKSCIDRNELISEAEKYIKLRPAIVHLADEITGIKTHCEGAF